MEPRRDTTPIGRRVIPLEGKRRRLRLEEEHEQRHNRLLALLAVLCLSAVGFGLFWSLIKAASVFTH